MRKVMYLLGIGIILTACQNNNSETEQTRESSTEEHSNSNVESTTEETDETLESNDTNNTAPSTRTHNESVNPTQFDVQEDRTHRILFDTEETHEDRLSFNQNVITRGMSQSEVEAAYGTYDLIHPGDNHPVTIYGNLGVMYSEMYPYGTDEHADSNVNPDDNYVEDVIYYANASYDEVIDWIGEPDIDVYETTEGPVDSLMMEYILEEREETTVVGRFWLNEDESGEVNVDIMTVDEVPNSVLDAHMRDVSSEVNDEETEDVERFISTYIDALMRFYNSGDETVLDLTLEDSENYEHIINNQTDNQFSNYDTINYEIVNIEKISTRIYEVTVDRTFVNAASDDIEETTVIYTVYEINDQLYVVDFIEQ